MNRYTRKRKNNGAIQVYDNSLYRWVFLTSLSASEAQSCESLGFDSESSCSHGSGVSSNTHYSGGSYDSGSSYSYSSYDSGGSFGGCD